MTNVCHTPLLWSALDLNTKGCSIVHHHEGSLKGNAVPLWLYYKWCSNPSWSFEEENCNEVNIMNVYCKLIIWNAKFYPIHWYANLIYRQCTATKIRATRGSPSTVERFSQSSTHRKRDKQSNSGLSDLSNASLHRGWTSVQQKPMDQSSSALLLGKRLKLQR